MLLTHRERQIRRLIQFILIRNIEDEETGANLDIEEEEEQFFADFATYYAIRNARYSVERTRVPRAGTLHVLWDFARDPAHHSRFVKQVRVAPQTFLHILAAIETDPIFRNNSHAPQAPIELQLAVALHRMGRFGNAESLDDVAFLVGIGHGTVVLYTQRVISALLSIHGTYVRTLTNEERIRERQWVLERVQCPELDTNTITTFSIAYKVQDMNPDHT